MESKYGNLPPTPLLRKKSLVENLARKQKRNTLGGLNPQRLGPNSESDQNASDVPMLLLKQQSCFFVPRKSTAHALGSQPPRDANTPPLARLRRRAESEPPSYSPAWGKRRRVWHAAAPLLTVPLNLEMARLLQLPTTTTTTTTNRTTTVCDSENGSDALETQAALVPTSASIAVSASQPTAPQHASPTPTPTPTTTPTATPTPTPTATPLTPSSRAFAQHHGHASPSAPSDAAKSPTLTSASVQQFFDAQKGSFQKLGNGMSVALVLFRFCFC
jgi:hypothetical protein